MPSNVEIKANIPDSDIEVLRQKAETLSDGEVSILKQEDTFFNTQAGRLKLRQIEGAKSQLIFYDRPDQKGPKLSEYHFSLIDDPENLKITLDKAYGIKGCVKKTRYLYLVGQTRVHVDSVDGLGDFMELEVVMKPEQTVQEGQDIANELMNKLGVQQSDLIDEAYMDLILKKKKESIN